MSECLVGLRDLICIPYLDDILCYNADFEEHKQNLRKVLQRIKEHGIKLNPEKCILFKRQIKYLGKVIDENGYRDDEIKTEASNQLLEPPRTVRDLRQKLGFIEYYRTSIKDFSRIAEPLYCLLSKNLQSNSNKSKHSSKRSAGHKLPSDPIDWKPKHQQILELLTRELKSPKVMAYPYFTKPFIVHCDASETGLGAVLYQEENGSMKVISYASRTLSPAEKNYHLHSGKLEFLALKWAITINSESIFTTVRLSRYAPTIIPYHMFLRQPN